MFKLKSRLLVVILTVGLLTVLMSCSQKDDITAPKSLTKVWLSPQRLPTAIDGMIYELWASKVPYTSITQASQVKSFGRFSHIVTDTLVAFLDETGNVRADSNEFSMEGDLFDFSYLFVAVEPLEVDPGWDGLPGPQLVGQNITGSTDTIRMFFPQQDSLWESTIRCNFDTPTDDNPWFDGFGLWWCYHSVVDVRITDTLSATVSYSIDTIEPIIGDGGDTLNLIDLRKAYPDSVWYVFDTVLVDFGRDTLALGIDGYIHYGATQKVIRKSGTEVPRIIRVPAVDLDTSISVVSVDVFAQDLFGLPDLTPYGWKYKGWIVSNYISQAAIGAFTPPAWDFTTGDLIIPGYEGGLLTTGTFSNEEDVDDADPFTLEVDWEVDSTFYDTTSTDPLVVDTSIERFTVLKRPRFPGEDFLDTAAIRAATNGVIHNAAPYILTRPGSVFISLEPDNMITDTTNFPLIPFVRSLPSGASSIWTLINFTGVAAGAPGLPKIEAKVQRY